MVRTSNVKLNFTKRFPTPIVYDVFAASMEFTVFHLLIGFKVKKSQSHYEIFGSN